MSSRGDPLESRKRFLGKLFRDLPQGYRGQSRVAQNVVENGPSFGEILGSTVVWKFIPGQLQDPDKVTDYLQEECCGTSGEEQFIAVSQALATIFQTLAIM